MAREPKNLRVDSCETWYLSHTYDNTQVVTSRAPNSPGGTKVGGANPNPNPNPNPSEDIIWV